MVCVEFTLDSCPKCKDEDEDFKSNCSCRGSGHRRQWLCPKKYEVTPKENWGLWATVKGANNAAWNTILDKDDSTIKRVGKVGGVAVVSGLAAGAAVVAATGGSIGGAVAAIGNATGVTGAANAVATGVTGAAKAVATGVTGAAQAVAGAVTTAVTTAGETVATTVTGIAGEFGYVHVSAEAAALAAKEAAAAAAKKLAEELAAQAAKFADCVAKEGALSHIGQAFGYGKSTCFPARRRRLPVMERLLDTIHESPVSRRASRRLATERLDTLRPKPRLAGPLPRDP